jgi:peroxiredoxin Q/BCP
MGMLRTTFLIDETGTIIRVILPKEVNTKEHAAQILRL